MSETIDKIDLKNLMLDPENPRLPPSLPRDQQTMLDYIAMTTTIEELMEAIAENDFFPGEPLIVTKGEGDKFIVVEGNRRLTALRLLQDPNECSKPGERVRSIASSATHKPINIPVIVSPTRNDILPYLGFRHITGVKQWEPLAKARYIHQIFNSTNTDLSPRERYEEVARTIGSRRDHIKRNLDALAVYEVIYAEDFYNIDRLNEELLKFSVLSTAIADDRIGKFLGVVQEDEDGYSVPTNPIVNPTALNKNAIKELTIWLYEQDEKGKTKVGESRNIRLLSAVVDNPKALKAFRSGSPLKIAYQLTSDLTSDFMSLLYQADGLLAEAASIVATIDYNEDGHRIARRILDNIRLVGRTIKEKKDVDDEF